MHGCRFDFCYWYPVYYWDAFNGHLVFPCMSLCSFIWLSLWNLGTAKCFDILTTTTIFVTSTSYISYHNHISLQNLIPQVSHSEKTARFLPFQVSFLWVDLFWRLMVKLLTRSSKLRHYNDIKMSTSAYLPCRKSLTLKSPETRLFDQTFVQDNIKGNV